MRELIRSLADALPADSIQLGSAVESIEPRSERWRVRLNDGEEREFDHVVVAVPPRPAAALLRDLTPAGAEQTRFH